MAAALRARGRIVSSHAAAVPHYRDPPCRSRRLCPAGAAGGLRPQRLPPPAGRGRGLHHCCQDRRPHVEPAHPLWCWLKRRAKGTWPTTTALRTSPVRSGRCARRPAHAGLPLAGASARRRWRRKVQCPGRQNSTGRCMPTWRALARTPRCAAAHTIDRHCCNYAAPSHGRRWPPSGYKPTPLHKSC